MSIHSLNFSVSLTWNQFSNFQRLSVEKGVYAHDSLLASGIDSAILGRLKLCVKFVLESLNEVEGSVLCLS